MPLVREHGAAVVALTIDERGQARTAAWKVEVAERLIRDLTVNYGMNEQDIIVDCLTFPIATGQEETRRDAIETIEAIARAQAPPPRRADDPRRVQRLVRAQAGRPPGAQLGVPRRVRAGRARLGHRVTRRRSSRWRGSPTSSARSRWTWSTTGGGPATTRWPGCSSCSRAWTRSPRRRRGPPSSPRCRWRSGSSGGSSTASGTASRPTSTWPWRSGPPWRSSTTSCSTA